MRQEMVQLSPEIGVWQMRTNKMEVHISLYKAELFGSRRHGRHGATAKERMFSATMTNNIR